MESNSSEDLRRLTDQLSKSCKRGLSMTEAGAINANPVNCKVQILTRPQKASQNYLTYKSRYVDNG